MPKPNRSIDKALELTPEATAFIRGGSMPQSSRSNKPLPADCRVPAGKRKRTGANANKTKQMQTHNPPAIQDALHPGGDFSPHAGILVPITTRLRLETADALRRACLEQKLQRKLPCTQQEIVEIALRTWLIRERYIPQISSC